MKKTILSPKKMEAAANAILKKAESEANAKGFSLRWQVVLRTELNPTTTPKERKLLEFVVQEYLAAGCIPTKL